MSTLTIVSSPESAFILAVKFSAIAYYYTPPGRLGAFVEYINGGGAVFVDQNSEELSRIFPDSVRLDKCLSLRDMSGSPASVYVNPSAVISVLSMADETEGCIIHLMGQNKDGLKVLLPFRSVIAKF